MPTSRVTTLAEAVSLIEPGNSVALGLALEHAVPFAVGHELIRQDTGDLTLVGPISDALFDQLVGAGLVARIRAAWVGNVSAGLGRRFREAAEAGRLDVEDHSNLSLALALQAAAAGVPFLPTRSLSGSDVFAESDLFLEAEDPAGGGRLALVPAIEPDWAVVHAQRASPHGDAQVWGNTGVVAPAVGAARRVLVTAEQVVDPAVIKSDPDRVLVTRERVAAVVECPFGAHPSPVVGRYGRDHEHFLDYAERTRTQEGYDRWAEEWVHGLADREEYVGRVDVERLRVDGPAAGSPDADEAAERAPSGAAVPADTRPGSGPEAPTASRTADVGPGCTAGEVMVAAAARQIEDGDVVFVGMRLPLIAFQVAVSTHAPDAVAVYESGIVRDDPAGGLLHTMCDLPNQRGALATTGMLEIMGRLGRGDVDLGFLGGAEVDRYGNLNTTWIRAEARRIRLPGSGGACDIACLAGRTVIVMPHEARRFVERVGYVTSPGHAADGSRRASHPAPGGGPSALVTSKATFGFDGAGELFLRTVHPGAEPEEVRRDFPWELKTAEEVGEGSVRTTPAPSGETLALIRSFDPEGFWTR